MVELGKQQPPTPTQQQLHLSNPQVGAEREEGLLRLLPIPMAEAEEQSRPVQRNQQAPQLITEQAEAPVLPVTASTCLADWLGAEAVEAGIARPKRQEPEGTEAPMAAAAVAELPATTVLTAARVEMVETVG
jgi:hypothetical protein